jgi:hypothetical protein
MDALECLGNGWVAQGSFMGKSKMIAKAALLKLQTQRQRMFYDDLAIMF